MNENPEHIEINFGEVTVSIAVITYESSSTVIDTLESILRQDFPISRIELIVSDDGSSDDTVPVCEQWIREKWCGIPAKILHSKENTGIPANLNRAVEASTGFFFKSIAGDDILCPNCISDCMAYIAEHRECEILFARAQLFSTDEKTKAIRKIGFWPPERFDTESFSRLDANAQNKVLLETNPLAAPTKFCRTVLLKRYPYNEIYQGCEDWPMWYTLTKCGVHLDILDKVTVLYRQHPLSIMRHSKHRYYSTRFWDSEKLFYLIEVRPVLMKSAATNLEVKKRLRKLDRRYLRYDLVCFLLHNKRNLITAPFYHVISRILKIFS